MGGCLFSGLVGSQSSIVDKIFATVGHLVFNSNVTSAIHFSWHKPPYDQLHKTDDISRLATFISSLLAAPNKSASSKGFTFCNIDNHTINTQPCTI